MTISVLAVSLAWISLKDSPFFERFLTMVEFVDGGGLRTKVRRSVLT